MIAHSGIARRLLGPALLVAGCLFAANALAAPNSYAVRNLVSDGPVAADHNDPNLVNGWGIAFNPNGFVWVADNETGVSTLYDGFGNPQSLVVAIPPPPGTSGKGTPTGIVFNGTRDFRVSNGVTSDVAAFLFASLDGVIAGWAPTVDGTHALVGAASGSAAYTGLALAGNGTANLLYAADFRGGKIDVYDTTFAPVSVPGRFADPRIPADYAPFNIQAIQGDLYVAFAKREPGEDEEIAGPGLGFVDVFDADGFLLRRVASHGKLNAPWGMALAPAGFGRFAGRLLVGNFGDGTINAYDAHDGHFVGQLRTPDRKVLKIDGLWGIAFGNGVRNQPTGTLFFAAGPDEETHGVYGSITPAPSLHGGNNDDGDD